MTYAEHEEGVSCVLCVFFECLYGFLQVALADGHHVGRVSVGEEAENKHFVALSHLCSVECLPGEEVDER